MHPGQRLLTALLSLGLGLQLGRMLARLLKKRGAEGDPVTASGRLVAAWRALESLEPLPLFVDPFAAGLAGSEAVHEALALARPFPQAQQPGDSGGEEPAGAAAAAEAGGERAQQQPQGGRRFCYSNVAARVWWFDRQLATALGTPAGQPARQPRQVVVLGAGYDTRAWRLRLPAGVRWFEVDLPFVVAAKREALQQLGAGFQAGQPCMHPMQAASWTALAADLCQPGWTQALLEAGLDSSSPTVWVAEGLLMYLTPNQATVLLREMADVSCCGSSLILHQITSELLGLIEQGEAAYAPFPPELLATWRSGFPLAREQRALVALFKAAGWPHLGEATSRARIAAQVVASQSQSGGGGGAVAVKADPSPEAVGEQCDFEARPDVGRDRWTVFITARKGAARPLAALLL